MVLPTFSVGEHGMKFDRAEAQLQAEIRDLTAKLKEVREEIQQEIRQEVRLSTHRPVVSLADDRPRRRRPSKKR